MIVLKNTDEKINSVIHVADIHIRLRNRHDEFESVFNKFYTALEKSSDFNSILVIAGDLVHNKVDLSPECVKLSSEFLKNCADRIPTILIAGNHDALLNNKTRLDTLTPIVNNLNHPNLYYLKDTGLYRYENILFNNFSVFDESEQYIRFKDIPSKYKHQTDHHIALFHGPVNNAVTDIGYTVSNRAITNDLFDGHDIVMLGDIHKHQVLQHYDEDEDMPVIAYASSMIQQNHGEDLKGHGFLMWDLKRKIFKHYELQNDYGYFTVEINKGKLITDISEIPKKARIRVKCFESIPSQVKEIINEIKNNCELVEAPAFIRTDNTTIDLSLKNGNVFEIHNILDVDYQNKLIEDNLKSQNIETHIIEKVKDLNKEINKEIPKDKTPKNIRWKPKTFEFHNMFSYGEDNFIDFTKLKGTIGLFAPNAAGKSSIMDALAFCIFDKFSKGFKAVHVLNTQKMSFNCKFNFEINGEDFFIERGGKVDKKGNVKVDVKFYKINKDFEEVPLNGEARRSTNDIIRDYVGNYDDFILTVLSIQNSKAGSFIDLGQTERKDLLCQFMGLTLFDQLYTISNEKFKETNLLLKNTSKDQLNSEMNEVSRSIDVNNESIKDYNIKLKSLEKNKESYNNKLLDMSKNIVNADNFDIDISQLEYEKVNVENDVSDTEAYISELKNNLDIEEKKLKEVELNLSICGNIENEYEEYKVYKQKENDKLKEIEKLKLVIKNKVDKLKKLDEHKYDPNCKYCVNNIFVKDAINTKESLENDKNKAKIIVEEYKEIKSNVETYGDIEITYKECIKKNNLKVSLDSNKNKINNRILQNENSLMSFKNKLKSIEEKIDTFYKNKDIIENNKKLMMKIEECKQSIKSLDSEIKITNSKLFSCSTEKGKLELQHKNLIEQLDKLKTLEESYESYKLYTNIISRDGIPYEIITKTLPEIEKEVNNILHQLVEFNITLQTDGKNIMASIVYEDRQWPLEMASGMEKFVSGLAIRVALINISNLPRPNILAIDEGFGCADGEHLAQMGALFNYLKSQFEFIWIISHLDQMRDMVDKQIEIKKDNGFSKVVYK